jgi:DNA (cytosine-5)-methyltransferase 1
VIYGSVCSGIEAATAAWHPLHWTPAFFSEIEPFPRAVLAHHYPHVPIHGDFTTIGANDYRPIQLLVGGTPCQDFSVAGLRAGIGGNRGNLTLEFVRLLDRLKPRWFVWENVPGVLSSDGGRAFSAFLGAVGQLGYGFAYRILDAQFFGVPQWRRRVYVVGCLGNWRAAAAVLFERESLRGDSASSRKTRKEIAPRASSSAASGGEFPDGARSGRAKDSNLIPEIARCNATGEGGRLDGESVNLLPIVASTLDATQGEKWGGNQWVDQGFALPIGFNARQDPISSAGRRGPLDTDASTQCVLAEHYTHDYCHDRIYSSAGDTPALNTAQFHKFRTAMRVRRLTPRECERLMGFPDDYTLVAHRGKLAADGPRYKALGNSFAVPVVRWIGERIDIVNSLVKP